MSKRNVTMESTVYVSGWGWRDNDCCGRVVATTETRAERLAYKAMRDEARRAQDDDCLVPVRPMRDYLDGIAWYGVHAMRLGDLVNEGREAYDAIQGLNDDGYTYID